MSNNETQLPRNKETKEDLPMIDQPAAQETEPAARSVPGEKGQEAADQRPDRDGTRQREADHAEIMDALEDLDFDPEQMDKLYESLESQNIKIIDDFEADAFADLEFVLEAAESEEAEPAPGAEGIAIDDPVKVYLKEIGRVPLLTPGRGN